MKTKKYTGPDFGGYASFIPALYKIAEQGEDAMYDYVDDFMDSLLDNYKNMPLFSEEKRKLIHAAFVRSIIITH